MECNTLYPQYPNYETMSNVQSNFCQSEIFIENKKTRTFWGWKVSKNKNIKPHQDVTASYNVVTGF